MEIAVEMRMVSSEIFAPGIRCFVVTAESRSNAANMDIPPTLVVVGVKDVFGQGCGEFFVN